MLLLLKSIQVVIIDTESLAGMAFDYTFMSQEVVYTQTIWSRQPFKKDQCGRSLPVTPASTGAGCSALDPAPG